MTVSTTDNSVSYTGDGATTNFAFTFACLDADEIDVFADSVALTLGVVVNLNADQSSNPGGSVDITPAPNSGVVIDIIRATKLTQETDYNAYDPFPAETHEMALDRLTLITQDQQALIEDQQTLIADLESRVATLETP